MRPAPEPTPRRRKKEERTGGFMSAAIFLLERVTRDPLLHSLNPSWDAFTWLRIWDYNDPVCMHLYENSARGEQQHNEGLSPRL
jgi:hypothetical protein